MDHDARQRSHSTLGRVVDDLGHTLLEVLAGSVDRAAAVSGVVIHDARDPQAVAPGSLLLGVGVGTTEEVVRLLHIGGGTVLVVRMPFEVEPEVARAAEESGAVLLGLTRGASWAQVAALLRSSLAVDDVGDQHEPLAGFAAGDLFSVANAIAGLIDAPVTIEDRSSRVLAFSGRQDEADQARVETILGRQVPAAYLHLLEERGVFRDVFAADEPVDIKDIPGAELDRVAVRVRAGDEILGSIWAAVSVPLSTDRRRALADSARLVALHLLRARAGEDVGRRLRSDLVATVLEGGLAAGEAASRLGLTRTSLCVLALGPRPSRSRLGGPDTDADSDAEAAAARAEADFQRAASAFTLHLTAVHPRSAVAMMGGVQYGVLPVLGSPEQAARRATAVATEFVDRLGGQTDMAVGIGRVVDDRTALPRSRVDADRALRVLRETATTRQVAAWTDVHVEALLLELADLAARDGTGLTGPLSRLADYDRSHDSELVATLRAWLDAFGDVNRAAAAVHVHANTFRYRLRRVGEVGELDLTDPDARFAAMLLLRLEGARSGLGTDR